MSRYSHSYRNVIICLVIIFCPIMDGRSQQIDTLINRVELRFALRQLGYHSLENKHFDKALSYFQEALDQQDSTDENPETLLVLEGLAAANRGLGRLSEALKYQRFAYQCKDSIARQYERKNLASLREKFDSDLKARELELLKIDQRNNLVILILLALLIVLIAVCVVLLTIRQRVKVNYSEKEQLAMRDSLKSKNDAEQALKSELEFKLKELTSFTLSLIQKKEMLCSIKGEIEQMRAKLEGEPKAKLNRIIATISLSQRQDKDWENFKLYFEQVHHGFFDKLHRTYPDLNSNDLKLCALIRLNLDTKQIASIMDIAPESAKVAKHRIRKKLGLTHHDDLHVFFSKIASSSVPRGAVLSYQEADSI